MLLCVHVLQGQPPCVGGSPLYPHQLVALNWLRRMWACGQHAIFADEMVGAGRGGGGVVCVACILKLHLCLYLWYRPGSTETRGRDKIHKYLLWSDPD